jgi:hypothetical protein
LSRRTGGEDEKSGNGDGERREAFWGLMLVFMDLYGTAGDW